MIADPDHGCDALSGVFHETPVHADIGRKAIAQVRQAADDLRDPARRLDSAGPGRQRWR
jgi:hypothetical protein